MWTSAQPVVGRVGRVGRVGWTWTVASTREKVGTKDTGKNDWRCPHV